MPPFQAPAPSCLAIDRYLLDLFYVAAIFPLTLMNTVIQKLIPNKRNTIAVGLIIVLLAGTLNPINARASSNKKLISLRGCAVRILSKPTLLRLFDKMLLFGVGAKQNLRWLNTKKLQLLKPPVPAMFDLFQTHYLPTGEPILAHSAAPELIQATVTAVYETMVQDRGQLPYPVKEMLAEAISKNQRCLF